MRKIKVVGKIKTNSSYVYEQKKVSTSRIRIDDNASINMLKIKMLCV